jgi:outer membrane receptor protein involved in Fe transport
LEERYQTTALLRQGFGGQAHDTVIVLPNPFLHTEHNTSFEVGAEWIPRKTLILNAAFFLNELHDLVGEFPTARAASEDPLLHAASLNYSVRERVSIERARVQGIDLTLKWQPSSVWSCEAGVQFNETEILRASVAPAIVGKRLANVSKSTATVSGHWQISKKATLQTSVRYLGKQFGDLANTLPLRDAVVADFRFTYALTPRTELFYSVSNLFDTRVETSRSVAGTLNVGMPRFNEIGVRLHW